MMHRGRLLHGSGAIPFCTKGTKNMRSEQEMMTMILDTARADERIRAVGMNGSRTNPDAPRDIFQDYDIVYFVTDMQPFLAHPSWVDCFGKRLIMQMPEGMSLFPPQLGGRFSYLMQFEDGNRIDLTLAPLSDIAQYTHEDSLTKILLDKDGRFPVLPPPDDRDYHVKRPDEACFQDCCCEFLWTACYVAKGIWRDEFLYAAYHLDRCVREMLLLMLSWQVGTQTAFDVSTGKCGKYLKRYLPDETMQRLKQTYRCGTGQELWQALYLCMELFRESGSCTAKALGYRFPSEDWERIMKYLQAVERLPRDAKSF